MRVVSSNENAHPRSRRRRSAAAAASAARPPQVVAKDGIINGLYRGIAPRITRVIVENALLFALYEQIARVLDRAWP